MKYRLFVLTDITSLEAGVREPDDGQSLIRLLVYSSDIDIEGLAASSNLGHGQVTRPELIHAAIGAYEDDRPKLLRHRPGFPPADLLRCRTHAGQPAAGPDVPVERSIGRGRDTAASDAVIRAVDRDDERPLWIALWGGTADLAQALWNVRETRPPAQVERFLEKIRVHAIGDQDSTGPWIKREFPGLFYITRGVGGRGIYRGGDERLSSAEWVAENVAGHGALGSLYPNYRGGDIWSGTLGAVRGVKEGDTPSFLNLLGANPLSGWGGTVVGASPNRWEDEPVADDSAEVVPGPFPAKLASVYRHRPAFQADFARRLDWCL